MTTAAPAGPVLDYRRLPIPAAAFEVLSYCAVVAAASLAFLAGWLSVNAAVVLTVALLSSLIALSWIHLGQGRHPVFLFLCTLMLFQGGRLIAYCLGVEPDPMRITAMERDFVLTRSEQGIVLLCLAASAILVYLTCRWNAQPLSVPDVGRYRHYLPYLYLLFAASLPVQLFKNYRYYQYVQEHGGYAFIFTNHSALAASVPFLVRVIPLISFPVFIALFVLESRKRPLVVLTTIYFASASFVLLLGSRVATFSLILVLWYVARVKSSKQPRVLRLTTFVLLLLFAAYAVQVAREAEDESVISTFSPARVIAVQGASLNVTEIAVKYRSHFSNYSASYMLRELQNAFVANDYSNYYRGRALGFDISVNLNPWLFSIGYGTGSSYIAEAYVIGGIAGVVVISSLIGLGLRYVYQRGYSAVYLVLIAMVLPDVFMMPRNGLLDWISVLARSAISVLLLFAGWKFYELITSIRHLSADASLDLSRVDT